MCVNCAAACAYSFTCAEQTSSAEEIDESGGAIVVKSCAILSFSRVRCLPVSNNKGIAGLGTACILRTEKAATA